jgi:NADH-quinone oxidoreductase subunit A
METLLLTPPIAFTIILVVSWLLSFLSAPLAYKGGKDEKKALTEAYACGEEMKVHRVQPEYSQFFPFAFFFTLLHVVTLVVATVPVVTIGALAVAVIYIAGALLGLWILFRR